MQRDRGEVPSDHHTIFLAQLPGELGLLHAATPAANVSERAGLIAAAEAIATAVALAPGSQPHSQHRYY